MASKEFTSSKELKESYLKESGKSCDGSDVSDSEIGTDKITMTGCVDGDVKTLLLFGEDGISREEFTKGEDKISKTSYVYGKNWYMLTSDEEIAKKLGKAYNAKVYTTGS